MYIGETGRSLETKKPEHIDAVKNFDLKKSALLQYAAENDHYIDWDNAEIVFFFVFFLFFTLLVT